ncbi:Mariner Mos1 transposase [Eumeta japonica]|uniref:Mariner Mos1 transposase n=1 Tax=Eumeta variegata TaxID=151549 RepID=A0A4C1VC70_EUMVA|nr:Mariner Mos1 transposase [Eumeta japonica]
MWIRRFDACLPRIPTSRQCDVLVTDFTSAEFPEAHRLLVETYNEAASSEGKCREWFQKFKNGDFDVEDKDRSGRPKIYEDVELEENSSQIQKELAL